MSVDDKLAKEKLARICEENCWQTKPDIPQLIRNTDLTDCTDLVCCQKFDTCNERCWPLICHLREKLAAPDQGSVRNATDMRERCANALLKAVREQSDGKCCDNCNCLGVRYGLEAIRALPVLE